MILENLSFGFGTKQIFTDVNMQFPVGKVTGVVGKNGVGKTTLFRTMKGIYKPQSGAILNEAQVALKGSEIGFLPTDPFFYPFMKGGEYLELVLGKRKSYKALADLFELPLDELVQNYSTGMKKKLAFAGVMGKDRKILILDEPFNGVDLQSNLVLRNLITDQKQSKALIVSSHILQSMLDLCDQIYYISEGFQYELYQKENFSELQKNLEQDLNQKIAAYKQEN